MLETPESSSEASPNLWLSLVDLLFADYIACSEFDFFEVSHTLRKWWPQVAGLNEPSKRNWVWKHSELEDYQDTNGHLRYFLARAMKMS